MVVTGVRGRRARKKEENQKEKKRERTIASSMILFENGSSVVQRQNFKAPDFPIGQQVYS